MSSLNCASECTNKLVTLGGWTPYPPPSLQFRGHLLQVLTIHYQSRSSVVSSRGRCSQSGCTNYQDQGNYLGFCEQCYRRYRSILFDNSESHSSATSSRSIQRGLHLDSPIKPSSGLPMCIQKGFQPVF
ncbi:hypothetical protein BSL78_04850 [Apostichopus japonicus]|uniref:Uncharacterized protein n=1 Tax=Stichopus japonicus TaxID=307972 RepID=A0A2G8LDE7_STIJA|nr:hypothetical protein BSL78_04850 [Apostichopus japonicus]